MNLFVVNEGIVVVSNTKSLISKFVHAMLNIYMTDESKEKSHNLIIN